MGGGSDHRRLSSTAEPGWFGHSAGQVFESVHTLSGLPWWATLVTCGVGLRMALLPLSTVQATHIRRLQPVMPLLKEHFAGKLPGGFGDISAALKQQQCSPLLIVGVPLFSIASFITASWGVRTLALHTPGAVQTSLMSGGALWFTDLTAVDAYSALPLLHIAIVLLNLELGLGSIATPPPNLAPGEAPSPPAPADGLRNIVGHLHTYLNMTMLTFFPLLCELPQAVFVFWLSSSSSSLAYQLFLKPSMPQAAPSGPLTGAAHGRAKLPPVSDTKIPQGSSLDKDMQYVKQLVSDPRFAVAATPKLRNRLQKLLDGARKKGKIVASLVVVLEEDPLDRSKKSIGIKLLRRGD